MLLAVESAVLEYAAFDDMNIAINPDKMSFLNILRLEVAVFLF